MALWQVALLTIAVFWYVAFIFYGTFMGICLCQHNNKWGILLTSCALPIIGTIASLIIMHKKHHSIDNQIDKTKNKF